MKTEIERNICLLLEQCLPRHQFSEVYHYAVFPAGKLFRPKLALAAFVDAGGDEGNIPLTHDLWPLAAALELHHAYTLVHDDLPAMDDDHQRRGRASTHIAHGQWQAILAGDGLSVASFRLLTRIQHPHARLLLAIATHALGPKGLIQGQVLDLSHEMGQSFEKLLLTHELKTARLIQLALVGGTLMAAPKLNSKKLKGAWRLGRAIGITFQLLDDLSELTEAQLSPHESGINPWLSRPQECCEETIKQLALLDLQCGKNLRHELSLYFKRTHKNLQDNLGDVEKHVGQNEALVPVMTLLHSLSK